MQKISLTVSDGGDSYACDWADWAYPRLLEANGEETKLTDLNWKSAKTAWGKVNLHKNCGGGSLTINGKAINYGIGTHANSVIHYELPKDHDFIEFRTLAGIDKGGSDQKAGKASSIAYMSDRPIDMPKLAKPSKTYGCRPLSHKILVLPEGLEVKPGQSLRLQATNMDIDYKGRIWVAEGRNYCNKRTQTDGDRIVVVRTEWRQRREFACLCWKTLISPLGCGGR